VSQSILAGANMISSLELLEDLVPTVPPYDFIDNFNRVQSTLLINGLPPEDCNLVLGTATSTGKTISAELFLHNVLSEGKRVIYVAPMKALVREKYEEWQQRFPSKTISIMTGDYKPTPAMMDRVRESHIVVVTSEMLDSQTRSAVRSRDHWIKNIGLLVMDEAHIIGSGSRGPAAEAGITRLCGLNGEEPRIVLLSATLPNSEDFAKWLHRLNGKKTYVLNSPWRPVPLEWHFVPNEGKYYSQKRNILVDNTIKLIKRDPDSKFLCFVHEKKTGHNLIDTLKRAGINAEFHRADLENKKRVDFENRFKDKNGDLKILISTSTLAWGINMPAKNVVILGTDRGIMPVDLADIIQMAGRAGRAGLDTVGNCFLLCSDTNTGHWQRQVKASPPVQSALLNMAHLRFQVLAEIDMGIINTIEDLPLWFERTLIGQQVGFSDKHFKEAIDGLIKMGMLEAIGNHLNVTKLGQISTLYYFTPDDVYHWDRTIRKYGSPDIDEKLSVLIGGAPSVYINYTPKEFQDSMAPYLKDLRSKGIDVPKFPFTPYALAEHLKGNSSDNTGIRFYTQNIIQDIERIETALTHLGKLRGVTMPEDMSVRIQQGIPKELTFLCAIPGIGPKKAWLLYVAGITDPAKLKTTKKSDLITCLGNATATKVWDHIQQS